MKLSEKILVVAEWLSSANNELLAEANDEQLDTLALSFVAASDMLRDAAQELEPSVSTESTMIHQKILKKWQL